MLQAPVWRRPRRTLDNNAQVNSWDGIQEFLAVVDTGSFTKAAKRLVVSTSYVSRQVGRLEDRLSVKLLARSTRVVRLTDAGTSYHKRVSDLAAGIEEANQAASGAHAELAGRIRVSSAGAFAEMQVAPVLAQFASEHPLVTLEMDFSSHAVDLIEQGFDFAIRYGVLVHSNFIARKLVAHRMVCAASPSYLERHGTPSHPFDLRSHSCLRTNADRWQFTDPDNSKVIQVGIKGRWRANNGHAILAGAAAGVGVAYLSELNLQAAIDDGRLIRILKGFEHRDRASWLVYPDRRHMPRRVRAAIDHLFEAFQGS